MTEKKFRPGWYQNNPDPSVTICDVENAYAVARKMYDPGYSHPGWGDLAKEKARIFIDAITMSAHDNKVDVSITTVIRDCVSRWDEFRGFVRKHDRRVVLGEPSVGGLLKCYGIAVQFSLGEQQERENHKRQQARSRELMKSLEPP